MQKLVESAGYGAHLGRHGTDGYWGDNTNAALQAFARDHKIKWKPGDDPREVLAKMQQDVAEAVGPSLGGGANSPTMAFSDAVRQGGLRFNPNHKDDSVMSAQKMLTLLGHLPKNEVDGLYGKTTEQALKEFAQENGIKHIANQATPQLLAVLQNKAEERLRVLGVSPAEAFNGVAQSNEPRQQVSSDVDLSLLMASLGMAGGVREISWSDSPFQNELRGPGRVASPRPETA